MKDPAFLFYPNDYLGGTMGMTFEQKGAYVELLMLQFNRGHMTSHMIGQVFGQNYESLWNAVQNKFIRDSDGMYYNERLEIEINKRKSFVDSRKNNISGTNQYTKKDKKESGHMGGHMTSHMENRNRDININNKGTANFEKSTAKITALSFDEFWDVYDKKVDRKKVEPKWAKITEAEREQIKLHVPMYVMSTPDKKYRKNAEAYLNARAWENEIIINEDPIIKNGCTVVAYKLKPTDDEEFKEYRPKRNIG